MPFTQQELDFLHQGPGLLNPEQALIFVRYARKYGLSLADAEKVEIQKDVNLAYFVRQSPTAAQLADVLGVAAPTADEIAAARAQLEAAGNAIE